MYVCMHACRYIGEVCILTRHLKDTNKSSSKIYTVYTKEYACGQAYIHAYMHAYIHTYIYTYIHSSLHSPIHMYVRTYIWISVMRA
jgi:hypothetical protein